jgi:hypothetical protein
LPLLWSLVVGNILWKLNSDGYCTVVYADDTAIPIDGKFPHTVSEVLQTSLCTVQQWCDRANLSINPNKTAVIPFTKKGNLKGLKERTPFNKMIELTSEVKYLGLTWKKQLDNVINKAYRAFWTCRSMLGKPWGLKPRVVYWIYTVAVRTTITYAATV